MFKQLSAMTNPTFLQIINLLISIPSGMSIQLLYNIYIPQTTRLAMISKERIKKNFLEVLVLIFVGSFSHIMTYHFFNVYNNYLHILTSTYARIPYIISLIYELVQLFLTFTSIFIIFLLLF